MITVTLQYPSMEEFLAAMAKLSPTHHATVIPAIVDVEAVKPPKSAPTAAVTASSEVPVAQPSAVTAAKVEAKKPKAEKPAPTPTATETDTSQKSTEPAGDTNAADTPSEPTPTITLEDVRAKLSAISQGGKQPQVKALIAEMGATKLTEIPAEKYAEVLKKAEAL